MRSNRSMFRLAVGAIIALLVAGAVVSVLVGQAVADDPSGDRAGDPAGASPSSDSPATTGQTASESDPGAEKPAAAGVEERSDDSATASAKQGAKEEKSPLWASLEKFLPILILVLTVAIVLARLPKVEGVDHSKEFRYRRVMNWLPLGLTYAFLYMGRYNLKISKFAFEEMAAVDGSSMMGNDDFAIIFMIGTITYGASFVINGPLTDRYGGKLSILLGAGGSSVANLLMGLGAWSLLEEGPGSDFIAGNFVIVFSILYAMNMYFQSFGAVAIVKVNAPWFHVRERGVFGAIFGILISLGVYFAYDWGYLILGSFGLIWVFLTPAILLAIFWVLDFFMVQNTPGQAGLVDFDTADASSGDDGPQLGALEVFKLMMKNPIIITIALIEFCSGFLRQAIMQWYRTFAKQTDGALGLQDSVVFEHWGAWLCAAGILGGVMAGVISDRVFGSRRGPVAFLLYGIMLAGGLIMIFTYQTPMVSWLVLIMSMAVIGVHGMLSGTASMDFGGKKNVGVAVGIIDGFVYLGTGVMSGLYFFILPREDVDASGQLSGPATDPSNWLGWPVSMVIMAAVGVLLASRVWNAMPKGKKAAAH